MIPLHHTISRYSDAAIASSSLTDRWDLLQSPSGLFSLYSFRSTSSRKVREAWETRGSFQLRSYHLMIYIAMYHAQDAFT